MKIGAVDRLFHRWDNYRMIRFLSFLFLFIKEGERGIVYLCIRSR